MKKFEVGKVYVQDADRNKIECECVYVGEHIAVLKNIAGGEIIVYHANIHLWIEVIPDIVINTELYVYLDESGNSLLFAQNPYCYERYKLIRKINVSYNETKDILDLGK